MARKTVKSTTKKKTAAKKKSRASSKAAAKKKTTTKTKSELKKSSAKTGELLTPLATLREEMENLFDRFSEDWPSLPQLFGKGWTYPFADIERRFTLPSLEITPRVDVSESDDAYDIEVELPGMTEKDIELTLTDDSLTVQGEKQIEREEKKKNYHVSERSYGSFIRTFRVPTGVDQDKVSANYSNGILSISLPKTADAKGKKRSVEIKTNK